MVFVQRDGYNTASVRTEVSDDGHAVHVLPEDLLVQIINKMLQIGFMS